MRFLSVMHHYTHSNRQRQLRNLTVQRVLVAALFFVATLESHAEETLDYLAEHLLEAPMDFRYLSLPQAPLTETNRRDWLQFGGGKVSSTRLSNRFPMLSLNHFQSSGEGSGWLVSLFVDEENFSGTTGSAQYQPSFGEPIQLPARFAVSVNSISGSGLHWGVSLARNYQWPAGNAWQFGVVLEQIKIKHFLVKFNSEQLSDNFNGEVDYLGDYRIISPFVSYRFAPQDLGNSWFGSARVIVALPLPRQGLQGRFDGPNFSYSDDAATAGFGKHIPDESIGVGYQLEYVPAGLRFNLARVYRVI